MSLTVMSFKFVKKSTACKKKMSPTTRKFSYVKKKEITLHETELLIDYLCLFIVATGCPSERRPQKTVSCYRG